MIFVDGIILSQRHSEARPLAGMRLLSYREVGDINRDGQAVEEVEAIKDKAFWAWIKGSHETAIRVVSHEKNVALAGNPGRWGRPDNLFGFDLAQTIERANHIVRSQGLPEFTQGDPYIPQNDKPETRWTGARVWSIHLTQNYLCGSPENAKAVINWLDSQSIARVKKSRLGASTVVWGSLKYCQVEAYLKADEMLAHAKNDAHRETIKASPAYQWAHKNGLLRIEVKAAKDFLKHEKLTHLGDWNMATITRIFQDRTEVLNRYRSDIEDFDFNDVPSAYRMTLAAWLRGEDVSQLFGNRMTQYRHAKALRSHGIDILEKRNVHVMPVRIRTIEVQPASVPDWYDLDVRAA